MVLHKAQYYCMIFKICINNTRLNDKHNNYATKVAVFVASYKAT